MHPEIEDFSVDEKILRDVSAFFDAAFQDYWKESKTGVVSLTGCRPRHFSIYVDWIYSFRNLPTTISPEDADAFFDDIADLYILGDHIQNVDFCDAVVDSLADIAYELNVLPRNVNHIYSNTPSGSSLRKLVVDIYCTDSTEKWLETPADLNQEFLYDVVRRFAHVRHKREEDFGTWFDPIHKCRYHRHPDGIDCYDVYGYERLPYKSSVASASEAEAEAGVGVEVDSATPEESIR